MDIDAVTAAIVDGELDAGLDEIAEAIAARRRTKTKAELRVGDKARIGKIRPRYLVGLEVTVEKVNDATALCRFLPGDHIGKFSLHRPVRIPLACLEAVVQ